MSTSVYHRAVTLLLFILLGPLSLTACLGPLCLTAQTIVYPDDASDQERFAAHEVRRYVYLRTGELLPLRRASRLPAEGDVIAIGSHRSPLVSSVAADMRVPTVDGAFIIRSVRDNGRTVLLIAGGDTVGTLYGAYRFAEHLGIGFGLAGDAIPDGKVPLDLDGYDEVAVPRFETRGVLPYHDFFPGPDGWTREDYLSVISQLPKLGMNFIGFHTYMPRYGNQWMRDNDYRTGPEPTVWVGLPEDVNADGTVAWSYPATYAHTLRERSWAFSTWDASEFAAGSADLFAADGVGAPLVGADVPRTVAESNAVFNRVAAAFDEAFGFAGQLGVRTAVGTEIPLGLEPAGRGDIDPPEDWVRGMTRELKDRIEARGDDPADPAVVRDVYRGIFERIMRAHPLDYYWLWSYEIWSANPDGPGVTREQVRAIEADIEIAQGVLEELGNPFEIAHAGWILGTTENHAELESAYPLSVPFYSSWGDADGYDELSAARVKWPGVHLEQDWGLLQWQGGVYAAWEDIAAAQGVDAEGSIGNIWRTTILDPNIAGVKDLHWAYGSSIAPPRMEIVGDKWVWMEEQYRDWARRQMGPEVADGVAAILAEYDGQVPTPTGWTEWGPGEVLPNARSWRRVRREYAFVDEFEALRGDVVGPSNLERFDYWLKTLQLLREMAEFGTVRHDFERAMARTRYERALEAMTELARLHERITTLQLERARNASDIGEIIQFQLVNWKATILDRFEDELRRGLGRRIPPEAYPTSEYLGEPRVFVAPARTSLREGESLSLTATVLGTDAAPRVYLREMGKSRFREFSMRQVAEAVYTVEVPQQAQDFEYYVAVEAAGEELRWPATAPERNHTVIIAPWRAAGRSTSRGERMKSLRFPVVQPIILLVLSSTLVIGCAVLNSAPGGSDEIEPDETPARGSTWQPWEWNGYETFPSLYFAAEPEGYLSDEQMAKISRFSLAILEFRMGQFVEEATTGLWAGGDLAGFMDDQVRRFKARYPEGPPMLVYRSGMWAGSMYRRQWDALQNQSLFLQDARQCAGFIDYPRDVDESGESTGLSYCRWDFRNGETRGVFAVIMAPENIGSADGVFFDNAMSVACDEAEHLSRMIRGERGVSGHAARWPKSKCLEAEGNGEAYTWVANHDRGGAARIVRKRRQFRGDVSARTTRSAGRTRSGTAGSGGGCVASLCKPRRMVGLQPE